MLNLSDFLEQTLALLMTETTMQIAVDSPEYFEYQGEDPEAVIKEIWKSRLDAARWIVEEAEKHLAEK